MEELELRLREMFGKVLAGCRSCPSGSLWGKNVRARALRFVSSKLPPN